MSSIFAKDKGNSEQLAAVAKSRKSSLPILETNVLEIRRSYARRDFARCLDRFAKEIRVQLAHAKGEEAGRQLVRLGAKLISATMGVEPEPTVTKYDLGPKVELRPDGEILVPREKFPRQDSIILTEAEFEESIQEMKQAASSDPISVTEQPTLILRNYFSKLYVDLKRKKA